MRVLVVDDHPLVRMGIISTLSLDRSIDSIQEASTVDEAVKLLSSSKPEVAIIDLNLGDEDGLEVVVKARECQTNSKFIVLTSSSKREDFERAQHLDVDGYILKEAFTEDIIYAFKVINRGKKFFDSTVMQRWNTHKKRSSYEELTDRELEVFRELGRGMSNRQIAQTLYISEHTVKKHVSAILGKLELSHRTEAALMASNLMH
jgi:DNA-binding NarL/FixJ family response regulator